MADWTALCSCEICARFNKGVSTMICVAGNQSIVEVEYTHSQCRQPAHCYCYSDIPMEWVFRTAPQQNRLGRRKHQKHADQTARKGAWAEVSFRLEFTTCILMIGAGLRFQPSSPRLSLNGRPQITSCSAFRWCEIHGTIKSGRLPYYFHFGNNVGDKVIGFYDDFG